MDPEFAAHVQQNLHRIRWWCDAHNVYDIAQIPWDRLWNDVKKDMKWDNMPRSLHATTELAMAEAAKKLEKEGVLFPKGWDNDPRYAPK